MLNILINNSNPNINVKTTKNFFDSYTRVNLNEINYRVAFTVEGYHDQEMKNDPRYVKYMVRIFGIKDGEKYQKMIPYHICTDSDWALFPEASFSSVDTIEQIRQNPKRGMYCIDWDQADIQIYGNENNMNYQNLDIVLVPCQLLLPDIGFTEDAIPNDCLADRQDRTRSCPVTRRRGKMP